MIRDLDPERDAGACDAIVAGLPAWFGVDEGIAACAIAVRSHRGLVAIGGDEVIGFLTLEPVASSAWEVSWIAVRADRRGHGVGRDLVETAISVALPASTRSLYVKTLSDRDGDPGPEYRATRGFYLAAGFRPVAELDLWGPENPCQLLERRLAGLGG